MSNMAVVEDVVDLIDGEFDNFNFRKADYVYYIAAVGEAAKKIAAEISARDAANILLKAEIKKINKELARERGNVRSLQRALNRSAG